MNADWFGVTVADGYLKYEEGPEEWQITRRNRWGFQIGLTWGPLRRPYSILNKNPWLNLPEEHDKESPERNDIFTLRLPFFICPWIHIWVWRGEKNPARFYLGCKIFKAHDRPNEDVWRNPKKDKPGYYITPSASFRTG